MKIKISGNMPRVTCQRPKYLEFSVTFHGLIFINFLTQKNLFTWDMSPRYIYKPKNALYVTMWAEPKAKSWLVLHPAKSLFCVKYGFFSFIKLLEPLIW